MGVASKEWGELLYYDLFLRQRKSYKLLILIKTWLFIGNQSKGSEREIKSKKKRVGPKKSKE